MAKNSLFSNKAFNQAATPASSGFHFVPQISTFHSVFDTRPLDAQEAQKIEQLLMDNFRPEEIDEKEAKFHAQQLTSLTAEIKAIGKQGTVLMGERVHKAKELLKPYRDGTFTKWLESVFGSRKTGYNMLAYYQLYTALPQDDLKERFKKIPQRAAYILASKEGDIETKTSIIREYHNLSHEELVELIQKKFPMTPGDKRAGPDAATRYISEVEALLKKLHKRKESLTPKQLSDLKALFDKF